MLVTIAVSGDATRAVAVDATGQELDFLVRKIVQPLMSGNHPSYAASIEVYQGDVTHKCGKWEWEDCEPDCIYKGSLDYNETLRHVKL